MMSTYNSPVHPDEQMRDSHRTVPPYSRLTVEHDPDGGEHLTYLGYPLRLSPDESRLLRVLLNQDPADADPQGYFSVDAVLASMRQLAADAHPLTDEEWLAIFFDKSYKLPRVPYSPEQIAILAGRINRKSAAIGGRKLILGKSHHGYQVNPYM